jgi:hypothetical protein
VIFNIKNLVLFFNFLYNLILMTFITIKILNLYKYSVLNYPNLIIKNGGIQDKELNLLSYNHTGLGNNLFQISNCLVIAWKYNINASFPDINLLKNKLPEYPLEIYKNLNKTEFKYRNKYQNLKTKKIKETIFEIFDQPFFYSNLKDYENELIKIFAIDQKNKNIINKKYPNLYQNNITVSLHVRRGDFVVISKLYNSEYILKNSYYYKAINYFNQKLKQKYKLLIFSDDIQWCRQNFKQNNIIFIEDNYDYIDLWMMSLCNHNIISSSSFSWWGAFLNQNNKKIVIAPQKSIYREKKNCLTLNQKLYPPYWIIMTE